ncbi:MAG: AAA family ATPase, partial [Microcystaceae cyanobacterium]
MKSSQLIKIQNFRCFQNIEINGFKKINLISGKNNTGKTSLLEALLLYFYPLPSSVYTLHKNRKESSDSVRKNPKDAWNNLFYGQSLENPIDLEGSFKTMGNKKVNLSAIQSFSTQLKTIVEDFGVEKEEEYN